MKQEINKKINLVVHLIVEDDNDDDEVEITGQTFLLPRNRLDRIEKLKQIKDDLDKEIEYIVTDDDKNETKKTGYKPPPVHPRENLKTFNKSIRKRWWWNRSTWSNASLSKKRRLEKIERKKKKVKKEIEAEIETLGQTPMHPRKRLEMTNKIKNIKKEQKEEDEGEVTMEVNNQNKLKQADKILKDNIKNMLKF